MKKIPLLITAAILILLAGGYYVYENVIMKEPVKPWDLVPSETILVFEKDACASCIEQMRQITPWRILDRTWLYAKSQDSLKAKLNALAGSRTGLLVSAHVTRKDDFDFVFYLPDAGTLAGQLAAFALKGYRYSQRQLNEVTIHELSFQKNTFSWVVIGDVWAGSFTSFLIEDVIRTYHGKTSFRLANRNAFRMPSITGDAGNVYIDMKRFTDWFSVFLPGGSGPYPLGKSATLDIKLANNGLVFNGFSLDSAARGHFLSIFHGQSPVSFGLKNFVPNRAITFTSYGIPDGAQFHSNLRRFVSARRPHLRDTLGKLTPASGTSWDALYNDISDEIGVCLMEGLGKERLSKIVMIETKTPDLWLKQLNAISERLSVDTIFFERYSNFTIREIPARGFPEKMFWPLVQGFDHTYYASVGKIIVMAENLEELKFFLEDVEEEDIWGKAVAKNQFLESVLLESNVSLFVNTPKVWNVIGSRLHPRWRQFVRDHQGLLQSVQMSAFQFSHLNNSYYTNITLQHTEEKPEPVMAGSGRRNSVQFPQPIHKLHAVRSHVSRANEILIQDSLNDISLVSMEGKVLWKLPVGDQITSDIDQIDFYKNGKLQYIFTTHDAIHVIDRLGNYVPPYPLHLQGKTIQHLSVVDYDRSKTYRFLISEQNGRIWMYDKNGINLEGWTPKDAGGPLLAPPRHHRIKGKDYIIALRSDGTVNLYNRRGEMLKNFPLNLQGQPMGDYFLEMGRDVSRTFFTVVTRDGFKVRFNPEGNIENRETLMRASVGSQFSLIPENANKSYLVIQHDNRLLTISDDANRKILTTDYMSTGNLTIRYYHFGAGKTFISLTDKTQELSYVFDGSGTLLTNPPLESTSLEVRMGNSDQSYVFFIHGETLTIQPL